MSLNMFQSSFHFQDVFFSIGCAGSKSGARDRAIEQAMRVLDIAEVRSLEIYIENDFNFILIL